MPVTLIVCTGIVSISRRRVKKKLYFPGGKFLTRLGDVVLRTPSETDTSNTVPLPESVRTPPLPVTVIRDLRTTLSEEARNAWNFFIMWYPDRTRPRSAQVLLVSVSEGVRRTTSPRQVRNFPPGKHNFSPVSPALILSYGQYAGRLKENVRNNEKGEGGGKENR